MSTKGIIEMHLDMTVAELLLSKASKFKPRGVSRAMKMKRSFELIPDSPTGLPFCGEAGDYIVLSATGEIKILTADFVEQHFEPVAKRTRKKKGE